MCKRWNTNR